MICWILSGSKVRYLDTALIKSSFKLSIIYSGNKYKSALAFNLIVKRLLGEDVSWDDLEKSESFIEKIFKIFKG